MEQRVMDQLLTHGVRSGASDIHFKVGDRPAYRIDGVLRPVKYDTLSPTHTRAIATQLIGEDAKLDEIQEYDTSYSVDGVGRFRVNIYRQRGSL